LTTDLILAYNLLHMLRQFHLVGEEVNGSIEWLIKRLIKVGARVSYHGWRVVFVCGFSSPDFYLAWNASVSLELILRYLWALSRM